MIIKYKIDIMPPLLGQIELNFPFTNTAQKTRSAFTDYIINPTVNHTISVMLTTAISFTLLTTVFLNLASLAIYSPILLTVTQWVPYLFRTLILILAFSLISQAISSKQEINLKDLNARMKSGEIENGTIKDLSEISKKSEKIYFCIDDNVTICVPTGEKEAADILEDKQKENKIQIFYLMVPFTAAAAISAITAFSIGLNLFTLVLLLFAATTFTYVLYTFIKYSQKNTITWEENGINIYRIPLFDNLDIIFHRDNNNKFLRPMKNIYGIPENTLELNVIQKVKEFYAAVEGEKLPQIMVNALLNHPEFKKISNRTDNINTKIEELGKLINKAGDASEKVSHAAEEWGDLAGKIKKIICIPRSLLQHLPGIPRYLLQCLLGARVSCDKEETREETISSLRSSLVVDGSLQQQRSNLQNKTAKPIDSLETKNHTQQKQENIRQLEINGKPKQFIEEVLLKIKIGDEELGNIAKKYNNLKITIFLKNGDQVKINPNSGSGITKTSIKNCSTQQLLKQLRSEDLKYPPPLYEIR